MLIKTIKISEKGQIAIPKSIRTSAGLNKGDNLIIIQDNGRILLEKSDNISKKMKDDFKDLLKYSEVSLKDVWGNKEDDVWSEYL